MIDGTTLPLPHDDHTAKLKQAGSIDQVQINQIDQTVYVVVVDGWLSMSSPFQRMKLRDLLVVGPDGPDTEMGRVDVGAFRGPEEPGGKCPGTWCD